MNNDLGIIKRKLASNAFYLFLDYFAISIFSLFFWSSAGKFLSPSQYGIASISINLVSMLSTVAVLGLSTTLVKLLPEYLERKQINKSKGLIKFSLLASLFSSLLISSLFIVSFPVLYSTLNMPYHIFLLLPIIIILASLSQIVLSILVGYQNMRGMFFTDLMSHASKLAFSILLMILGFNYLGPVAGFGIGVFLVLLFRFRLIPKLSSNTRSVDKKRILFDYALPSFIISLSTILLTNGQITILGLIKGAEVTGIFSVAFILSNILIIIFRVMSRSLFPITSQLSARNNPNETQGYFINLVLRYSLFVTVPLLLFFFLFSDRLILIFASKEYLSASEFLPVLSIASVLYGVSIVLNSSVYAIGKPKIQRNIAIISSTAFILSSVSLTYLFSAKGMMYSYLISAIILVSFGVYNINKYLKIHLPIKSLSKIIISGLVSFVLLYFFSLIARGLVEGILFTAISSLIYLAILIILKFVTSEDVKVLQFVVNKSPLFKRQFNYIINKIPKS